MLLLTSCQQTCMTYTIAVCTVKNSPDDGQRSCPKHVEFHSKNKFEKLVHLVGFIIRNILYKERILICMYTLLDFLCRKLQWVRLIQFHTSLIIVATLHQAAHYVVEHRIYQYPVVCEICFHNSDVEDF